MALSDAPPPVHIPTLTAAYVAPQYLAMQAFPQQQHAVATITPSVSPDDEQQRLPCDQYKEFLDASYHERADMIENLVDLSVDIVENIWPTAGHAKVVATKGFIREILRRSKATYFMLQISLFYLFRAKRIVQAKLNIPASQRTFRESLMCCGRRMFLASLMVASKYIHDKGYRNKAWADASGLPLQEINASEMAFLQMVDYQLYISKTSFEKWYTMLDQRLKKRKQQQQQQLTQQQMQEKQQQQLVASSVAVKMPPSPPSHYPRSFHPYQQQHQSVQKTKAPLKAPFHTPSPAIHAAVASHLDNYPSPASPSFRFGPAGHPPDLPDEKAPLAMVSPPPSQPF
ncbi:hypothetical protein BC940DRAFT_302954 [Gongronella butleri]|nr:hypothetical protein BC940DRAFT_302954 [Gongronella butleri]